MLENARFLEFTRICRPKKKLKKMPENVTQNICCFPSVYGAMNAWQNLFSCICQSLLCMKTQEKVSFHWLAAANVNIIGWKTPVNTGIQYVLRVFTDR